MGLFKEKIYLGAFCRLLAQKLIAIKHYDLSAIDKEQKLVAEEYKKLNDNLNHFRLICLAFLLMEKNSIKGKRTGEDIGYISSQAFKLACQDNNYTEEQVEALMKKYLNSFENYINYIQQIPEKELQEKSVYSFLCSKFADDVMPINNHDDDAQRYKHWFAFDVAMQTFKIVINSFNILFKNFKIIDM